VTAKAEIWLGCLEGFTVTTLNAMRNHLAAIALSVAAVACSSSGNPGDPVLLGDFGSFNQATVEVTAEGGLAALTVHHIVRHDDRSYLFTQRKICGQSCGAALDSASGTLTPAATDSLFNIVLAQSPLSLKGDYGTTRGGADMMTYTLTISAEGNVKTIRADDGTMPPQMRQIVQSVRETISAARK
jgi:hypothetical protein